MRNFSFLFLSFTNVVHSDVELIRALLHWQNRDEVETLARELHCRLYRTSVKEDLNVSQVFQYLAEKYLSQLDALDDYCDEPPRSITIGEEPQRIFRLVLTVSRLEPSLTSLFLSFLSLSFSIATTIDAFVPHSGNGLNGHPDTKIQRFQRWASRLPRIVDRDTIRLQPSNRKKIIITKNKLRNACSF